LAAAADVSATATAVTVAIVSVVTAATVRRAGRAMTPKAKPGRRRSNDHGIR
jgi:hypothetical protein